MTPESLTLLQNGAATLIGLMLTDAWEQVRLGRARLFGDWEGTTGLSRRDASRNEVLESHADGDPQGLADIEGEWRIRLRRLLTSDPTAAGEPPGAHRRVRSPIPKSAGVEPAVVSGCCHNSTVLEKGTLFKRSGGAAAPLGAVARPPQRPAHVCASARCAPPSAISRTRTTNDHGVTTRCGSFSLTVDLNVT